MKLCHSSLPGTSTSPYFKHETSARVRSTQLQWTYYMYGENRKTCSCVHVEKQNLKHKAHRLLPHNFQSHNPPKRQHLGYNVIRWYHLWEKLKTDLRKKVAIEHHQTCNEFNRFLKAGHQRLKAKI